MSVAFFAVFIACLNGFMLHQAAASKYELISATIYSRALDAQTISYTIESAWRASEFNVTAKDVDKLVIGRLVKFQLDTRSKDTIMVAGKVIGLLGLSDIFMARSTVSVTYTQSGPITAAVIDLGTYAASITTTVMVGDTNAISLRAALPPKITVCNSVPTELHIATIPPPRSTSSYTVYNGDQAMAGPTSIRTSTGTVMVTLQEAAPTLITIRLTSRDLQTGFESHVDVIVQVWIDPKCRISSKDAIPLYTVLPTRFITWIPSPTSFQFNPSYSSALTTFETFPNVPTFTLSTSVLTYHAPETSELFICLVATDNLVGTNEWACMIAVAIDQSKASIRVDLPDTVINSPVDLNFLGTSSDSLYQILIADANQNVIIQTDVTHDLSSSQYNSFISYLTAPAVPGTYTVIVRNARTSEVFGLGRWNVVNSIASSTSSAPGTTNPQSSLVQIQQAPSGPVSVTSAISSPVAVMDKSFQVIVHARNVKDNLSDSGGVVIVTLADVLFFGTLNSGMASVTVTPSKLGVQPLIVTLPYSNSPILKNNVNVVPLPSEPFIGKSTIIEAPDTVRIGENAVIEWIAHSTSGAVYTNATSFRFTTSMDWANTSTLAIDSGVQSCNQSSPNTFCVNWIALKVGQIVIQIRNDPRDRIFYTKNVTVTPGDIVLAQTTVTGSGTSDHAYVGDTLQLFMTARDRYGNTVPPTNASTEVFQVGLNQGVQADSPKWDEELQSWKSQFTPKATGSLSVTISLNGVAVYIRSISILARTNTVSVQWIWLPISFSIAGLAAAGYANYRRRKRPNIEDDGLRTSKAKKAFENEFAFANQTGIATTTCSNSTQRTGNNISSSDFTMSGNMPTADDTQETLSSDDMSVPDATVPSMADLPIRNNDACSSGEAMIEMNSYSDESITLVPIRNGIEWKPAKDRSRFLIRSKQRTAMSELSMESGQNESHKSVPITRSVW